MKFSELKVGDWFHDSKTADSNAEFVDDCILMKISDTDVFSLNYGLGLPQTHEDYEVAFVSRFYADEDFWEGAGTPFQPKVNNYKFVEKFDEIPMYSLYKGKGQTYYKKINDTDSIVFWSPNSTTMGKIFSKDKADIHTHKGHYYICNSGKFDFPETDGNFPIPTDGGFCTTFSF